MLLFSIIFALLVSIGPSYAAPLSQDEAGLSVAVSSTSPFALSINYGHQEIHNTAVLAGNTNVSATPVSGSRNGELENNAGKISFSILNSQVVKISLNTSLNFVGARFTASESTNFYGVWEYPWKDQLTNTGVRFELKGTGDSRGVNWSNARAPFFFTDAGHGVYVDTLDMGSFDFTKPGAAEFIFNASSLVYYVIVHRRKETLRVFSRHTLGLAIRYICHQTLAMDRHSGAMIGKKTCAGARTALWCGDVYGKTHRKDTDREPGTGNESWGNFDFDPAYYPTPKQFIANLSHWGFDFQVWAANRAFLDTELFNIAKSNGWLFPGINPEFFLGPALNLSIPEAYQYFKKRLSYFPSVGVKGYKIDRGKEGEMSVYEQNIQATLFDQLCYETMVERWGEGNFYNFARNAVDHSRSKTAIWNGDSHSNYTGLSYSIASGIRAGLIGFSQWGSDTGGYIRELAEPNQELWSRWMWFSAFSPVYEIMIGTNHTPWYPTATNPYTSELVTVLKETANLHYDLFPYIKSYTYQAHLTGIPVMRAAFLDMPEDRKTYTMSGEYFFGSEFFVAPIATPNGRRSVYFPEGTKYLEYFNKTSVHAGGTTAVVEMDVHYVPAYVRAGAIVPRGQIYQGNNKWTDNWKPELTIELYPSTDVPCSKVVYYNGDASKVVQIIMTTDSKSGEVVVDYGPIGLDGTLVMFTKNETKKALLHAGGGLIMFSNVVSLFED